MSLKSLPSLEVNIKADIKKAVKGVKAVKAVMIALLMMVVMMGDASVSYAKGKGKAKRKLHQLTPEITQEIVHVTLPIKWLE